MTTWRRTAAAATAALLLLAGCTIHSGNDNATDPDEEIDAGSKATGFVQVVVVAQVPGDKVTCDIRTGTLTDAAAVRLASSEAAGLGAIATCAATVPE